MNQDLSDCETRSSEEAKNICYKNKKEQESLARQYSEKRNSLEADSSQMKSGVASSLGASSVPPTKYVTEDNASFGVEQIVLMVVAVSIVISAAIFIYLKKFKS